jgi:hypothetical protein
MSKTYGTGGMQKCRCCQGTGWCRYCGGSGMCCCCGEVAAIIVSGVDVVRAVIVEENVDVVVDRVFNQQINLKDFYKNGSLNNKLPLFMLWLFLPNYFAYQLALN